MHNPHGHNLGHYITLALRTHFKRKKSPKQSTKILCMVKSSIGGIPNIRAPQDKAIFCPNVQPCNLGMFHIHGLDPLKNMNKTLS
jgi:hypothetical protein